MSEQKCERQATKPLMLKRYRVSAVDDLLERTPAGEENDTIDLVLVCDVKAQHATQQAALRELIEAASDRDTAARQLESAQKRLDKAEAKLNACLAAIQPASRPPSIPDGVAAPQAVERALGVLDRELSAADAGADVARAVAARLARLKGDGSRAPWLLDSLG